MATSDYSTWSAEQLLERVRSLERQLEVANIELRSARSQPPVTEESRIFDPSRYSTRHIALKFAYLGRNYNGLEHHKNNITPLETIEEVLWHALVRARLIWPPSGVENEVSWENCDYTKCGRTDKGVSSFGQVIGIRVRSNRPLRRKIETTLDTSIATSSLEAASEEVIPTGAEDMDFSPELIADMQMTNASTSSDISDDDFDDVQDEIPYMTVLNRLLPPEIRILAWCPAPPNFSARFSCKERRYRYFFTQPAFNPTPGQLRARNKSDGSEKDEAIREGWLDIDAMKTAAKKFEGLHDFRNFCKIDPGKQIDNFMRRMFLSEIRELDPAQEPAAYVAGRGFGNPGESLEKIPVQSDQPAPKVYQFVLHGSAFLWHQVRHMVAILFLVGQRLESPSIIDDLFDVQKMPQKPLYEMADDAPLVLWDCIFPENGIDMPTESHPDALPWIWIGDAECKSSKYKIRDKFGIGAVVDSVWKTWRKHKIDEVLAGSLLNVAAEAGKLESHLALENKAKGRKGTSRVFLGGDSSVSQGVYVPLSRREKLSTPEVINARYRDRKKEIAARQVVANQ